MQPKTSVGGTHRTSPRFRTSPFHPFCGRANISCLQLRSFSPSPSLCHTPSMPPHICCTSGSRAIPAGSIWKSSSAAEATRKSCIGEPLSLARKPSITSGGSHPSAHSNCMSSQACRKCRKERFHMRMLILRGYFSLINAHLVDNLSLT